MRHFQGGEADTVLWSFLEAGLPGLQGTQQVALHHPHEFGLRCGSLHSDGERWARALEQTVRDTTKPWNLGAQQSRDEASTRSLEHSLQSPPDSRPQSPGGPEAPHLPCCQVLLLLVPVLPPLRGQSPTPKVTGSPGCATLDLSKLEEEESPRGRHILAGTGEVEKPSRNHPVSTATVEPTGDTAGSQGAVPRGGGVN